MQIPCICKCQSALQPHVSGKFNDRISTRPPTTIQMQPSPLGPVRCQAHVQVPGTRATVAGRPPPHVPGTSRHRATRMSESGLILLFLLFLLFLFFYFLFSDFPLFCFFNFLLFLFLFLLLSLGDVVTTHVQEPRSDSQCGGPHASRSVHSPSYINPRDFPLPQYEAQWI